MTDPEILCLELCRAYLDRRPIEITEPVKDTGLLIDLLISNKLLALAGCKEEFPADGDPAGLLADAARTGVMEAVNKIKAGVRLTGILDAAGIPCLLMRGVFAGVQLHGDPLWRQTTDVDALIPFTHRDDALELLIRNGYRRWDTATPRWYARRNHYHWSLIDPLGERIDLHWALHHRFVADRIDYAAVFQDAVGVSWSGLGWRAPSVKHTVLLGAAHVMREEPDLPRWWIEAPDPDSLAQRVVRAGRLLPLMDLAAGIRLGDGSAAIVPLARAWDIEAGLMGGILLARALFGIAPPDDIDGAAANRVVARHVAGDLAGRLRQRQPFAAWNRQPGLPGIFTRIGLPLLFPPGWSSWSATKRLLHGLKAPAMLAGALIEYGTLRVTARMN